jgi:uncharacterized protein
MSGNKISLMHVGRRHLRQLLFFIMPLFVLIPGRAAFCVVNVPEKPEHYVVDLAGIVEDSVENQLNGYLQELEQKTNAQMIVLTINSLEGDSIEDFSISVAHDKWKLGRAGEDKGVLLVVSVSDKKYRFEVGYGLEAVLPDSFVGEVGRNFLVPHFRKGDYSGGIFAASIAVVNAVAADAGVEITGMPKINGRSGPIAKTGPFQKLIGVLFFLFLIFMFIKYPRTFLALMVLSSMGNRRGSGGGFGGGGFGSFGGGGGGGFGGGGASGGW